MGDKVLPHSLFLSVLRYGGPNSLQVTSRFGYGSTTNNWLRYLGSAFNVAVASVDARGTVGKGEDWKFLMYKELAHVEVEDQIEFEKSVLILYNNSYSMLSVWHIACL